MDSVLVINQREVEQLLPMRECMDIMQDVLKGMAEGDFTLPPRSVMWLPEQRGALASLPSYWHSKDLMGLKASTVFAQNSGTDFDAHHGVVMLFEGQQGRLLCLVDCTSITAIRTAGVSGVATDLLARKDASKLAILGSGVQAVSHLQAMLACRPIKQVQVYSKTLPKAQAFAAKQSQLHGLSVQACRSAQEAVAEADIICTVTSSPQPILQGAWLQPGVHINAVGAHTPSTRELDGEAVRRCRFFGDRCEATCNEAGEFILAKKEGAITDAHLLGDLGAVLTGAIQGRQSDQDMTLFKSLGMSIEDLAAAAYLYEKAKQEKLGTWLEMGGGR